MGERGDLVWPAGCGKPSNCGNSRRCSYGCAAHRGRDIGAEVDAEIERIRNRQPSAPALKMVDIATLTARAEAAERERDELSGKHRAAEFALRNRESMASRYMGNKARAEAAEAKLAKAVEALSYISSRARWADGRAAEEVADLASATLQEITGGEHD